MRNFFSLLVTLTSCLVCFSQQQITVIDSTQFVLEAPQELRDGMLYSNFVKIKLRTSSVIQCTSSSQRRTGTSSITTPQCATLKAIFDSYVLGAGGDPNAVEFQRHNLDDIINEDKARNIFSVYLHVMVNLDSLISELRAHPDVEIVNPPYMLISNGLQVFDQGVSPNPYPLWHITKTQAPEAWVFMQPFSSTPQLVGMVDDGHVWDGNNELTNRVSLFGTCTGFGRHATMVGSCISANACSSTCPGPIGVGQDFIDLASYGWGCPNGVEAAFQEILSLPPNQRPRVVNCSFIFAIGFSHPPFPPLLPVSKFQSYSNINLNLIALEQLINSGTLVVAACGNFMSDLNDLNVCPSTQYCLSLSGVGYPFGLPGVIGVGATAPDYTNNPNFEYGMGSGNDPFSFYNGTSSGGHWNYNYNNPNLTNTIDINNQNPGYLEICAPGRDIDVAKFDPNTYNPNDEGYGDGTSFASPIIAGVAASMYLVNPNLNAQQVTQILMETADKVGYNPNGLDIGDLNGSTSFAQGYKYSNNGNVNNGGFYNPNLDYVMGNGRVNMLSAVMNAAGLNTGGFMVDNTFFERTVIVNNVNDHNYLTGNNYNEEYEYDALLNQNGALVKFKDNGTIFRLSPNSTFQISNGATMSFFQLGNLDVQTGTNGQATKCVIGNNGNLQLADGSFVFPNNSVLEVNSGGSLSLTNGTLTIQAGATLHIKAGATLNLGVGGNLVILTGAYVCIETGANIVNNGTINFASGVNIGINPVPNIPNTSTSCLAPCNIIANTNYSGTGNFITASCMAFSNVTITNESCPTGGDGAISVTVIGGNTPYTYLWTPSGQTTQTATGLTAGIHTVTVTDASSNTLTATFTIAGPATIVLTTSTTDAFCSGGTNSGTATVNPSGGSAPYSYSWSVGQTTQTATGLSAGTYSVTVTDAVNCSATATVNVINSPSNPLMSVVVNINSNATCFGSCNGSVTSVVTGGTPFINRLYINSNGIPFANTPTVNNLCAGNYTLKVTDATGCLVIVAFTITEPPQISLSFSSTNATSCTANNGTATVNPSGGSSPYSFLWNNGQTTQTATGLQVGGYSVTVTDVNGCTASGIVAVNNSSGSAPTLTMSSTNITCNNLANGTATANVTGGNPPYTFSWSTGATTQSISGLGVGTYSVLVTDASSECAAGSVSITQPAPINLTVTGFELCSGGTRTATVTGGTPPYAYNWTPSGQTTQTATSLPSGLNILYITDANGCTPSGSYWFVVPSNLPNLTYGISTTNATGCGNADGTATVTSIQNGTPPYSFSWSNGQTTQTATGLLAGTYTVTVSDATGSSGCITSDYATVNNSNAPVLTISVNNILCGGGPNSGSATVSASGGNPPYTYSWSNGQTTQTATGLSAGTYTVLVTDFSGGCNVASATINSSSSTSITLSTSSTNATNCTSANGSASVSVVSGGNPPFAYSWNTIPTQTNPTATGLNPGVYSVTVTDVNGCSAIASVTVGGSNFAATVTAIDAVCSPPIADGTATANPTGGTTPYFYSWSNGQTTQTATGLAPGTYTVTVTESSGCPAVTVTVTINYNPPTFNFVNPVITGATIWGPGNIYVKGDVLIEDGGSLTILNANVEFSYDVIIDAGFPYDRARITVKNGGELRVSNSILSGCGGGKWDGIEVWGDPNFQEFTGPGQPQGKVEIINGSDIRNALTGVQVHRSSLINVRLPNTAGGVVQVTNSSFTNCNRAIFIANYNTFTSASFFDNTTFIYNGNSLYSYSPSTYPEMQFVYMENMAGVQFINGCDFISDAGFFAEPDRGVGIKTAQSFYTINSCTFTDLTKGIEDTYQAPPFLVSPIGNSTFTNVLQGIYIQGGNQNFIALNIFNIPQSSLGNKTYGMFVVGSTGFFITNNTFNPFGTLPHVNSYGAVFEDTDPTGGIVFKNNFNSTAFGIQAQKANINLKIRCNVFAVPASGGISWAVVNPLIGVSTLKPQGASCNANPPDNDYQAGNEFTSGCVSGVQDIFADATNGQVTFKYYAHDLNISGQPYTRPLCSTPVWMTNDLNICSGINKTATSCQSQFPGLPPPPPDTDFGTYITAIKNLILSYKNTIAADQNILAQGDAEQLITIINTQNPGQIKNALLAQSPYLSDRVLIAVIQRNPALPPGTLKEIIIANSRLSDAVMNALNNISLPNGIRNEINAVQTGTSGRELIENEIAYLEGEILQLEDELIRQFLMNGGSGGRDSAKQVLRESSSLFAIKMLAQIFLDERRIDSAIAMRDVVSADTVSSRLVENQKFCTLLNCMIASIDTAETFIVLDSSHVNIVRNIATSPTMVSSRGQVALTIAKLDPLVIHPIFDIPTNQKLGEFPNSNSLPLEPEYVLIYPNPANQTVTIECQVPENSGRTVVNIYNPIGEIIRSYIITSEASTITDDISGLPNGLYFYTLQVSNNTIAKGKLMVIK